MYVFFFFKQKTAYEMRISDWSSDVCSSDLIPRDSVPPEMGVELKQTNRSRRAWKLLSETPVIGRAALERIKYDTAYERKGYVGDLWDALEKLDLPRGELADARALLTHWDFTADGKGRADALALLTIKDFMSAEYQNKPLPDVRAKLEWAVGHLKQHFGRIEIGRATV